MTERTGGSDVGADRDRRAARRRRAGGCYGTKWFTSATTVADGAHARAARGQPRRRPRARAVLSSSCATRDGRLQRHPASTGSRTSSARARCRPRSSRSTARRAMPVGAADATASATSRRCSTSRARGTRSARSRRCGAASRSRGLRARGAWRSARRSSTSRCTSTRSRGSRPSTRARSCLAFRAVELLGAQEAGARDERRAALLRLLTPIAKLTTGKQAVAVASARRSRRSAAPATSRTPGCRASSRDAQVLPIWEGTTNVLSLDTLRALAKGGASRRCVREVGALRAAARDAGLAGRRGGARRASDHARAGCSEAHGGEPDRARGRRAPVRAHARPRARAGAARAHAQWSLDEEDDERAARAAMRLHAGRGGPSVGGGRGGGRGLNRRSPPHRCQRLLAGVS